MRRLTTFIIAIALIAAGCTASGDADTVALADQLGDISDETNRSVAQFLDLMDDEFEDRALLYQRIVDLRLPSSIAINLDKAQRVEPPPGSEAEAERYEAFLGELLLVSEAIDRAVALEDPFELALAAVSLEVAAGALAVSLPSISCATLTPAIGRDLCASGARDGYEADLSLELRRFVASFRPAFRVPDTFGDVIRGRVLATLQDDATRVLRDAQSRIAEIEPGPAYERLHQVLLDYFPEAAAAWTRFDVDAAASDPLVYGVIVADLEQLRRSTALELATEHQSIVSALPDSEIATVTDIWFGLDPTASQ